MEKDRGEENTNKNVKEDAENRSGEEEARKERKP